MFERYTEKARRVIFFARHEASEYGSPVIDTEHLLLGLLREDKQLVERFLTRGAADVRSEIEKGISRGERIPTSVEMPLTEDGKNVLNLAAEECERLGHKRIGTEHLLLGMLRAEGSTAARILTNKGAKLEVVRELLKKAYPSSGAIATPASRSMSQQIVDNFLAALKNSSAAEISPLFAKNAQIIDWKGKLWQGLEEIDLEAFFAPYAKRNVKPFVQTSNWGPADSLVADILWEHVFVPGESTRSMHRMTIIFAHQPEFGLTIFFLQVTPVVAG